MASPGKSFLRTERGERIDQPDYQFGVDGSIRAALDQWVGAYAIGDALTVRNYVLSGFSATASGTIITVTRGEAITGYRDQGQVNFSSLLTDGDSTKAIDISSYIDATYTVFVRLELVDSSFQNRATWNPLAGTPVETTRNIATRRQENWSIAVEQTAPGPEWCPLYTATKASGAIVLTDIRQFLFEGQNANSFAVVDSEWGGGTDRSAARATNGVQSLYRAIRGLQRQVQDVIGVGSAWWSSIGNVRSGSTAMSLLNLNNFKLDVAGNNNVQGTITPNVDNTYNWGSSANRFAQVYTNQTLSNSILMPGTNQALVINSDQAAALRGGVQMTPTALVVISGAAPAGTGTAGTLPIYLASSGVNAENAQVYWTNVTTGGGGANPLATAGFANVQTAKNTCKHWVNVTVSSNVITRNEGFNVGTMSMTNTTTLRVPFATAMDAVANNYVVTGSVVTSTPAPFVVVTTLTNTYYEIQLHVSAATAAVDLSVTGPHSFMLIAFGVQTT